VLPSATLTLIQALILTQERTGDSGIESLPAGSFGRPGEYLQWLEADLRRADAARNAGRVAWVIAGGHRPLHEIEVSHGELLRRYRVDAYFAGHTHSYTREMHTFTEDNSTMLSVVVGGAGCEEMAQGSKPSMNVGASRTPSRTVHVSRYASGVLRANRTSLHWQLIDSVDGQILDELTLLR